MKFGFLRIHKNRLILYNMKIAIVEPVASTSDALQELLINLLPPEAMIKQVSDYSTAELLLPDYKPDLVFLNPDLSGRNGFHLMALLSRTTYRLIAIASTPDRAYEAYRANALDYLISPFEANLLEEALIKAQLPASLHGSESKGQSIQKSTLLIPKSKGFEVIRPDQLIYGQSEGNYGRLIFKNQDRLTVNLNMKNLEKLLKPFGFFRIHQSYIINLAEVEGMESLEDPRITLSDGTQLPVARRKRAELLEQLKQKVQW